MSNKTWGRELKRGAKGRHAVKDTERVRHDNKYARQRWVYAEYDPNKAQKVADASARNKGPSQTLLASHAKRFSKHVFEEKRSPFHAQCILAKEIPCCHIPCVRTFYNHIDAGDIDVKRGDTPYHPGHKKVRKEGAHDAKVVPGRNKLTVLATEKVTFVYTIRRTVHQTSSLMQPRRRCVRTNTKTRILVWNHGVHG